MPEERFDTKDDVDDVIVILDEKPIEIRKSQRINQRIEAQIATERDREEESTEISEKVRRNSKRKKNSDKKTVTQARPTNDISQSRSDLAEKHFDSKEMKKTAFSSAETYIKDAIRKSKQKY